MTSDSIAASAKDVNVPAPPFRWGTRVALPVGILVAFALLFAGSMANSLTPAVVVEAMPVVERPSISSSAKAPAAAAGEVVVQAAGWIEPDPFATYATALIDGSVREVLFLEGDRVTAGDVLVRLVGDDARLALRRAQADLAAAEESWDANIDARREADVAAAAVRETQATLELARAEKDVEAALLRDAERVFRRRSDLVGDGSIAKEEHESAEAAAQAQAARVRVVERRIEELEAKLERMKAEARAAAQRLELRTEERRRLELARVAADEARLRVDRLEIRTPIDGVVMRRLVEPGSVVMTTSDNPGMSRVAELYDPASLQVRVDVPLADAAKIGVGQRAQVVVEVLPDRTFAGTVTRITNLADIQKNTLEVKVALDEPAAELKPDMLARVRFLAAASAQSGATAATGLSVFAPASAIANNSAWVVTGFDGEEGTAARRTVATTGAEQDDWLEIEEGLHAGDLVIVSATTNLQPQQRVRVRKEGKN